jgi:hypothetical protein
VLNKLGNPTPMGALTIPSDGNVNKNSSEAFFYTINTFLATPFEGRPLGYETTLNMPHEGLPFYTNTIRQIMKTPNLFLACLPLKQDCSISVRDTLPYGVYWFNPTFKNHVFVSTSSMGTFLGIAENFHLCPMNFSLRQEMHEMMLQMLWELKLITKHKDCLNDDASVIDAWAARPELPEFLKQIGAPNNTVEPCDTRKIAWMELCIFEDRDYTTLKMSPEQIALDGKDREQRRTLLVDYIIKSGLDTLWISLTPNIYYSPIARVGSKEVGKPSKQEERFLQGIGRFTQALGKQVADLGGKMPKIFVGFEIANNLYAPHLPTLYPLDLYGNAYPDLPVSIDRGFWQNEVKQSLMTFMKKWKNKDVSHGIKISGVVLDLEMYCRKKTGTFLSTMGFDGYSFKRFAQENSFDHADRSIHDRVLYLMQENLMQKYYHFLEAEAEKVGKDLYTAFKKTIPGCMVMCYTPNVLISWFYKGLFKGLSAKDNPLHLMTFNAEFNVHRSWFKKNGINAQHSSVLLMSKLQRQQDFEKIDAILTRHDGIWLNRYSRMVEPKSKDWTNVEQLGLPEPEYDSFLEYFAGK